MSINNEREQVIRDCEAKVQQILRDDILSRFDVRPRVELIQELRHQRDERLREMDRNYN